MSLKPLTDVTRRGVESLGGMLSASRSESVQVAQNLIGEARQYGLGLRDYLDLSIDVAGSEHADRYQDSTGFFSGYEATLAMLNLPVRNDFARGVVLDAASDTFQTYPGTRALFPEVVDDVVQWKYKQTQFESTTAMVSQSRTISGIEMVTTVVDDVDSDYQNAYPIPELGRIPVRTIRSGEQAVKFYKHGGGLRISYEFQRRARIDLLTPFQTRMDRETEISKVAHATGLLINGDGVNGAAPVVAQTSFVAAAGTTSINRKALLLWLVSRAKIGLPIDTVVGNWDSYVEWLELFSMPTINQGETEATTLARQGFQIGGVPILQGTVNFAISSTAPAGKLIGYSRGDTMEELIEAGSNIDESERAILNQSITYLKTQNAGYKIAFGDTRSIFNYNA